jgi:lysyl-tRNA synthetase class 2
VGEVVVLADCEDFYISLKSSPNYQRMLIDQNLQENLVKRGAVMAGMREYFVGRGFTEVDTPCLVRLPGMEPYLDVFKTHFEADFSAEQKLSEEMYLITSPEYQMKKLLVGGMEKIFQITKSFRNKETFSERHNPEFTILEWYRAYASYLEIMDDTEGLVKFLWEKFGGRDIDGELEILKMADQEVDLMAKWRRLTVLDAFKEFAGIDENTFFDVNLFRIEVKKRGYTISDQAVFEECFFVIFMNEIEGKLGFGQPVILYDYPVSMAALSKRCERDGRFAERFEVYVGGMELCNAFTELNDPVEQERRLNWEKAERLNLGKDIYSVDKTFIEALKFGMPPAGGNAFGVDRLIMLILGTKDIGDVLYFPHRDL